MKRAKQVVSEIQTREEMEDLVGQISALMLDGDAVRVEMEQRLQSVRAEYEARLLETELQLAEKVPQARDSAERNPEAFGGLKSIDMLHGRVGFRTGQPRLKPVKPATWDSVLRFLQKLELRDYVRVKQEVDKERILAERDLLGEAALRKVGLSVVQDETFFVEPKREDASEVVAGK